MHLARTHRLLAVFAATAALSSVPAHANLVVNGGFETGDFTGWTTAGFDPTPPFNNASTGVDMQHPQSGQYAAFFGTTTPSTISQTLATVVGATYDLSFYLMNEANVAGQTVPNSFMTMSFADASYTLINAAAFPYQLIQLSGTATSSSTVLSFTFTHTPAFWDFDTVDVEQRATVPEPSSIALAGLGGALALALTRRRRNV